MPPEAWQCRLSCYPPRGARAVARSTRPPAPSSGLVDRRRRPPPRCGRRCTTSCCPSTRARRPVARLLGAPVLDGHRQDSARARPRRRHRRARRRHARPRDREVSRARANDVWQDIKAGIIRGVSIGYTVERGRTRRRTARARAPPSRWTPKELSLVAIPADAGATTRGDPMDPDDKEPTRRTTRRRNARPINAGNPHAGRRRQARAHPRRLPDRPRATLDEAKAELFDALAQRPTDRASPAHRRRRRTTTPPRSASSA